MKQYELTDGKLVSLYVNGDEEAFKELVGRHKNRIFTAIHMIVKDRYLAEDLMQETFIKVINTVKAGRYNDQGKFLPWVMRIAHNIAIDSFRKSKRYPEIIMEDGSSVFNTLDFAESSYEDKKIKEDTTNRIKRLIHQLPEPQF